MPLQPKTRKVIDRILLVISAIVFLPIFYLATLALGVWSIFILIIFVVLWTKYPKLETYPTSKFKTFLKWFIFILVNCIFSLIVGLIATSIIFKYGNNVCSSHYEPLPDFAIFLISGVLFVLILGLVIKFKCHLVKSFKILLFALLLTLLAVGYFALVEASTARAKGCEAAIKAALVNFGVTAEIYYSAHKNYGPAVSGQEGCTSSEFFSEAKKSKFLGQVQTVCHVNRGEYSFGAHLPITNTWWCVDSKGVSRGFLFPPTTTTCP